MAQMSKSIYETRVQREAVESETAATIANEGRKPLEVQIEIFEHHPSSLQEKCKALEVYVSKVKDKKPAVLWTRCEAETKSPGTKVVFEAECRNKYAQESQVAELQHELQRNKSEQNNMHRDDMQRSKEYEKMLTERERAVAVRKEQEENFLKRLRRVGEAQESIIKTAAVNFDAGSEALKKTENAGKKAEQLTAAEAARTGLIKEQDEKAAAKKICGEESFIDISAVTDDFTMKDAKIQLFEVRSNEKPEPNIFSIESKLESFEFTDNIPASTRRGINLRSLRIIEASVKGLVAEGHFAKVSRYTELTTTDLVYSWVKKVTGAKRFVDCPDLFDFADTGVPQYFVSHAWKGSFALLVAHVLAHLKNASEDTRVWLDMFAVNQHGGADDPPDAQQENRDDVASFKTTLRGCVGTIVVVDLPRCNPASRGWCVYEWDKTITFLGLEALNFVGVSGRELNQIVGGVCVATAECFAPQDLAMIQKEVEENHGSLAAFDEALKLVLLFAPTSYKLDLEQLDVRSAGTSWNFEAVRSWLQDPTAPHALCIIGAAGTGKSSVSAALLREVLGCPVAGRPGEWTGPPTAFHLLKYSDQRRLEPVDILKSLACQLGRRLAGLAAALCALEGEAVANLTTIEAACGLLLKPLIAACAKHNGPVVILVDALDEADPPEQQRPGFDPAKDYVEPVANKAMHLVLAQLAPKLPSNIRFIFSARPETLLGAIKPVLGRAFPSGVLYLQPDSLRSESGAGNRGSSKGSNLLYGTVLRGCQLGKILEAPAGVPGICDVYVAYSAAFAQTPLKNGTRRLLEVVLAAFEPLPIALLQKIGLQTHLTALPGWGTLFYEADHHLHIIHKSLSDWLNSKWLPHNGEMSGGSGHSVLGAHLLECEVLTATDVGSAGGVTASVYALKYTVPHLLRSLGAEAVQATGLDHALSRWPFIRQVFRAGHGAKLVAALGRADSVGGLSYYSGDALRWLRRCFNDFEDNALTMEMVTLRGAPICSPKYDEASARLHASYLIGEGPHMPRTTLVLGRVSRNSWPLDTNILKCHLGSVVGVAFSPDKHSLASCSNDEIARVWDLASGQCVATLEGHSGWVSSVAYSPDGRLLVTGSHDKTARMWDLASGQCTATLEGHLAGVNSVAFSPDGCSLVTGSDDKTARVWHVVSLVCTATLEGHSGSVLSVALSPGGNSLATGSDDKAARLWDLTTFKCTAILTGHSGWVNCVAFNLDGNSLATGSHDKTARVWDLSNLKCTTTLEGHSGYVRSVAFSPNGRSLATGSHDMTARVWDFARSKCTTTLQGHSGFVLSVAFSPDGRSLATGSNDETARVWDFARGTTLEGHTGCVFNVAFSPDGLSLATVSDDKTARMWDLKKGQCTVTLEGHSGSVLGVAFSPDGRFLATGSNDNTARVWNLQNFKNIAIFAGHSGWVNCVAFSLDGRSLATGSHDKTARIWDLKRFKNTTTLEGHSGYVRSVAFSPNGRSLATGSHDMTARVWDLATLKCTAILEGHSGSVFGVALSSDGRLLATGSNDDTARVWDLTSGQCAATMKGHSGCVFSVSFSPDGISLATGSEDKTARMWDLTSFQCTATLEGHSDYVRSVAFSPDGLSLATGSTDKTARIWDPEYKNSKCDPRFQSDGVLRMV